MKKNYRIKKTISIKHFIAELGENFSEHIKKRLLDLEVRCVLTRKEDNYRFDIKHVEHTQHNCSSQDDLTICQKEYAYGQLIIDEGILYFSDKCIETDDVIQEPIVSTIYDSLNSEGMVFDECGNGKLLDDSNIDYVIDTILTVCPEVSKRYIAIMKDILTRQRK